MVIIRWYLETWSIHTLLAVVLLSGLMVSCTKEEQEKVADCCVTAPLTLKTTGALQGGFNVDNYLGAGFTWGPLTNRGTAGAEDRAFKVQITGPHTGRENCGVTQTLRHRTSNQAFLDGTAAYLGLPAGGVRVGQTFDELVLNQNDPFTQPNWFPRYRGGVMSFVDVPRAVAGDQGAIDFFTCFLSRGQPCQNDRCCVLWRWTVDFTPGNTVNTMQQIASGCLGR